MFAKALHVLDESQKINVKSLSCDSIDVWEQGFSLANYMKNVSKYQYKYYSELFHDIDQIS